MRQRTQSSAPPLVRPIGPRSQQLTPPRQLSWTTGSAPQRPTITEWQRSARRANHRFPAVVADTTAPASPGNVMAIARSASTATISWDPFGGESGFTVMASSDGGANYRPVGTTGPEATSFEVTGLSVATKYLFEVIARNAAGPSAFRAGHGNDGSRRPGGRPLRCRCSGRGRRFLVAFRRGQRLRIAAVGRRSFVRQHCPVRWWRVALRRQGRARENGIGIA